MSELPYTIDELRVACNNSKIVWREHALQNMIVRKISRSEVIECIKNGEIIEHYEDDKPFPSCLVFGRTNNGRNIHTVCSYADEHIYIITAYIPDTEKWENDLKTRKKVL